MLVEHGSNGDWLDLGCGPTTVLWALVLDSARETAVNDVEPEAVEVLREFAASDDVPPFYRDVMTLYDRAPDDLTRARAAVLGAEELIFDAVGAWPPELDERSFDRITAIGTFGLAAGPAEYVAAFGHLAGHLRRGGVGLGANWRRRADFAARAGRGNRWLTGELPGKAAHEAGLRLLHREWIDLEEDPDYDGVVLWAVRA
jgi:hypothetical protein